jgi:molecular chaperone DnaK (HSP70)
MRIVKYAYITVPVYFTEDMIQRTKSAAKKAGLLEVEMLPEPFAAQLAFSN